MPEEALRDEVNERLGQIEDRMVDGFRAVGEQFADERACTEGGYDRLDKALRALSGGITRLERKLDRMLALIVESRGRR